ncbi:hypothetical protein BGL78_02095 [Helicobacter pylori]|nr:hypothetical protein BGL78_02095 [Helicobacter pylori]
MINILGCFSKYKNFEVLKLFKAVAFNQAFLFLSVLIGGNPTIWLFDKYFMLFLKWGLKGSIKAYKRP